MDAWRDHGGSMRSQLKGKARAQDIIEIPDDEEPNNHIWVAGIAMNGQHPSTARQALQYPHKYIPDRLPLQRVYQENGVMHKDNIIDLENTFPNCSTAPIVIDSNDFAQESVLTYEGEDMLAPGSSKQKNMDMTTSHNNSASAGGNPFYPELDEQAMRNFLDAPLLPQENEQIIGRNPVNYIGHNEAKRQKNYHPSPAPIPVAQFEELLLENPYRGSLNPFEEEGLWADMDAEQLLKEIFPDALDQAVSGSNSGVGNQATSNNEDVSPEQMKLQGIGQVEMIFSGICRDYVSDLWDKSDIKTAEALIEIILEKNTYPKAKDVGKDLKRKRAVDPDEEAAKKYTSADRPVSNSIERIKVMRSLLSHEFPATPMTFISAKLQQSGYRLFSAYKTLEEADRSYDPNNPPYIKIRRPRKADPQLGDNELYQCINTPYTEEQRRETLVEFQLARKLKRKAEAERRAKQEAQLAEEVNAMEAAARGEMGECVCCFGDYPLNRMVHCDNDTVMHWFCRACAKQNADTIIGQSKYELRCMSMDDCSAGFDMEQRSKFLDENTVIALDRNEQEAVLRLAGIENLASCPFCPYAAEYPPVEINKEFRCQAPDCEKVSCRLCKLESHIPLSCEEYAKENGLSIRRQIEEAMSAALIRKCNKCGTPFIKEEGCNKMTCTRNGCHNIQCYVCHKSCTYDHFNDPSRGGKPGNCPLFENVEDRHNSEVTKAEKEALKKVREAHPEYSEEDLRIHLSERVMKDEEKRRSRRGNNAYAVRAQARLILQQQLEQRAARHLMAPLNPAGNINNPNGVMRNHEFPHQMPALPQLQAPRFELQQPVNFPPLRQAHPEHPPVLPIQGYQHELVAPPRINLEDFINLEGRYFHALGREQQQPPAHGFQGFQAMQQGYRG